MLQVFAARDAWTLGLLKWVTVPWFVNIFTSSIPEILFTANFFKENWSFFLSSAVAALWTTYFFLQAVPFPPMHSCACSLASFSWFTSFFHLVGEKTGPRWGLGLAYRGSVADQLRISTHMWGHKMAAQTASSSTHTCVLLMSDI